MFECHESVTSICFSSRTLHLPEASICATCHACHVYITEYKNNLLNIKFLIIFSISVTTKLLLRISFKNGIWLHYSCEQAKIRQGSLVSVAAVTSFLAIDVPSTLLFGRRGDTDEETRMRGHKNWKETLLAISSQ